MTRQKILGMILSAVLLLVTGCGTTTVTGPRQSITIDKPSLGYCLGKTAAHFIDFGSEEKNLVVSILLDAVGSLFRQSCETVARDVLQLVAQQVDPNTNVYVDSGMEETSFSGFSLPIDVANCSTTPVSTDFTLTFPFAIRVADTSGQGDAVFSNPLSLLYADTIPGQVANYLSAQHNLSFDLFAGDLPSQSFFVPNHRLLMPNEYMTIQSSPTITYMSGTYEIYQQDQLLGKPGQWSYIEKVQFPFGNPTVTFHSDAQAAGLCNSA
jgi:hypothetical protein